MLGRKSFTREELDSCKAAIGGQLDAYSRLTAAVRSAGGSDAERALEAFEGPFSSNMVLALDRYFVHRVRAVSGNDGNPLNEVELIADGVMSKDGALPGSTVIKYVPAESVLGLETGARISLTAEEFDRLSAAFLAEIEARFT